MRHFTPSHSFSALWLADDVPSNGPVKASRVCKFDPKSSAVKYVEGEQALILPSRATPVSSCCWLVAEGLSRGRGVSGLSAVLPGDPVSTQSQQAAPPKQHRRADASSHSAFRASTDVAIDAAGDALLLVRSGDTPAVGRAIKVYTSKIDEPDADRVCDFVGEWQGVETANAEHACSEQPNLSASA